MSGTFHTISPSVSGAQASGRDGACNLGRGRAPSSPSASADPDAAQVPAAMVVSSQTPPRLGFSGDSLGRGAFGRPFTLPAEAPELRSASGQFKLGYRQARIEIEAALSPAPTVADCHVKAIAAALLALIDVEKACFALGWSGEAFATRSLLCFLADGVFGEALAGTPEHDAAAAVIEDAG